MPAFTLILHRFARLPFPVGLRLRWLPVTRFTHAHISRWFTRHLVQFVGYALLLVQLPFAFGYVWLRCVTPVWTTVDFTLFGTLRILHVSAVVGLRLIAFDYADRSLRFYTARYCWLPVTPHAAVTPHALRAVIAQFPPAHLHTVGCTFTRLRLRFDLRLRVAVTLPVGCARLR